MLKGGAVPVGAGLPRETGSAEHGTGFAGVRGSSPLLQESRQLVGTSVLLILRAELHLQERVYRDVFLAVTLLHSDPHPRRCNFIFSLGNLMHGATKLHFKVL